MKVEGPEGAQEPESDGQLVRAAQRGDEAAFARLVRRYLRKAMAVALEFTGSREDAEDVVQETFVRVHRALRQFDAQRPFSPWFFTILRNTARNALKARRVRTHDELHAGTASSHPGPLENAERGELRRQIEQAVQQLPPMQQQCFRLCVVEGMSGAEVAGAVGIAESTVRVHVFKARAALQELLARWRDERKDT